MILNAQRQPVWEWSPGEPSTCPECGAGLVPKRGEIVVWHWSHKPGSHAAGGCYHQESEWHLRMKHSYLGFPGWEIEVPIAGLGGKYRADAMNPKTGNIREFVHSLSPHYIHKHLDLKQCGYRVLWIFDGNQFVSKRAGYVRNGGRRGFLKPKAYNLYRAVGGLVYFDRQLWAEWKHGVWYPKTGSAAQEIVKRMAIGEGNESR